MYHHQRSGLNLTMFRACDSRLGRWLSRDPLGESEGANLYAYVHNNPINRIDPLGLSGADVLRILNTFHNSVSGMTARDQRRDGAFGLPNAGAWLAQKLRNWKQDPTVQGCVQQSDSVVADLGSEFGQRGPDDQWNAYEFTFGTGLQHTVVAVFSNNPNDPDIWLDPTSNRTQLLPHGFYRPLFFVP